MLSQRRRAPVSSKLTRCHPTADTPTIDVHVNRVNRDHPLSAIHPARRRPRCPARCCCRRPRRRHCPSAPVRPLIVSVGYSGGFRCRVMSFRTVNKNSPSPLSRVVCYFHFSFLFSFPPSPSPSAFSSFFYSPSRKIYILKKRTRVFPFFLFLSYRLRAIVFFPAKRNQAEEEEEEERISQVEGKIGSLTTPRDATISPSPPPSCPYANGRNYKRRAGCSVIILTFNCSIPRDK